MLTGNSEVVVKNGDFSHASLKPYTLKLKLFLVCFGNCKVKIE